MPHHTLPGHSSIQAISLETEDVDASIGSREPSRVETPKQRDSSPLDEVDLTPQPGVRRALVAAARAIEGWFYEED